MAESAEHVFLSKTFLNILEEFSSLGLYGYTEAERKKYDFACTIHRDWNRPLVGQTLWSHDEGIYKDISTMITEEDADIWAYVVRDNWKNRSQLDEVVGNFRNSRYRDQLHRLKILRVSADFDADSEEARQAVSRSLRESIADDILFNVVFGNLAARDIKFFVETVVVGRTNGLELALLQYVATRGFSSFDCTCRDLQVGYSTLRDRITRLSAIGFISGLGRYNVAYNVTLKGRVFLDLIRQLFREAKSPVMSEELTYILRKLGLDPMPGALHSVENAQLLFSQGHGYEWSPRRLFTDLLARILAGVNYFGVDLENADYKIVEDVDSPI